MSNEQRRTRMQKAYEKWLHEVWSHGNVAVVDKLLAGGFVDHRPIPQFGATRDGHKRMAADWHAAFPDMKLTIEDVVVEGDKLVGRYSGRATHRGVFAGIPATGATVIFTEIDVIRFEGDRIAEWWHNEDLQPLAQQVRMAAGVA
jgi:predicted ester cyclase